MATTLPGLLLNTLSIYPKPQFMLVKKGGRYTPISSAEFGESVRHYALGLQALGQGRGDKLIILSENRPEWVLTDFANLCLGAITVPVYTTLVAAQIKYLINDSDARIVVVSSLHQWRKLEAIRSELPQVKHFVTLEAKPPGEGVLTLAEVLAKGRAADAAQPELFECLARAVQPADEASIIYTSGTTGLPKGVILTHGNFVSNIVSVSTIIEFSVKDTVLSFLPLSHVLERMVTFTYIYKGCSIAYAESVETVGENLLEVRPQIMVSAPRVFEKIYAKVMDAVLSGSALRRKIFFWGLKVGKAYGAKKLAGQTPCGWLSFRHGLADRLVFSKIIEKTGGKVRFFVSGGAPLSRDIAEFFYAVGLIILEGYGLTETSPCVAVNTLEKIKFGSVGPVMPGVEVKIAADGEILVRGPNVMKGYYKMPGETAEAFVDGWFKTGDIGVLDADGFLTITDRKKDLIVTAGGKNVAPQPIENILKTNPYIANAVVTGDRRRFISALVVPNFEKLEEYARFCKIPFADRVDLVRSEPVVDFVKSEIDRATPHLAPYERIKKIVLLERDFEIAEGEMTPSLKVRRAIVEAKYKSVLDDLYRE
ncbi:MAG: long-chain fatty acid--CoA ligase [Candidatus Aminicenantales bacterium]